MKELLPIILAALIWGHSWHGETVHVLSYCDNQAVVSTLRSRTCKQPVLMHMLRCLFFVEAAYDFKLVATYVTSADNNIADDLSRDNLCAFLLKVPTADRDPARVPGVAVGLLLDPEADWTSPAWTHQFNSIGTMV